MQTGRECYIEMGGATPEGPSTPVGTVWPCACTYHSLSSYRNPERDERKRGIHGLMPGYAIILLSSLSCL